MRKIDKPIKHIYECGIDNMITLITTRVDNKNFVMTSSTVAEVSLSPPILLVSISPERYTHDKIIKREAFAVNVLSIKQKTLAKICGSCSGRDVNKFKKYKIPYHISKGGLPFIEGCFANIGCKLIATHRYGDHTIFVGEMFEAEVYGERTTRHLLLSDMKHPLPTWLYNFLRKFPILHKLKRTLKL